MQSTEARPARSGNSGDSVGAALAGLTRLTSAQEELLDASAEAGAELMDFALRRFEARAKLLGDMCGCKTLDEAAAVHWRFAGEVAADYAREFTRLMEMAGKSLSDYQALATNRSA